MSNFVIQEKAKNNILKSTEVLVSLDIGGSLCKVCIFDPKGRSSILTEFAIDGDINNDDVHEFNSFGLYYNNIDN